MRARSGYLDPVGDVKNVNELCHFHIDAFEEEFNMLKSAKNSALFPQ